MESGVSVLQIILSFTFVVALIGICALIAKHFSKAGRWIGNKTGKKRIEMIETFYIDPKRKLVLIRCDRKEHLLLLGPESQLVVESFPQSDTTTASS